MSTHDLPLLVNIVVALCVAFVGGLIARRVGLPAMVGYLLAGVAIGPFTPGFVGDPEVIGQLAELGVIFLMFGVGLHFSLRHLWQVRDIAVPGALIQMAITTGLGLGLTQLWGWSLGAGLVLGLAISIASTVVLLRGLMDNGLLNTRHGRVAVGWLVLEDLATITILIALPALTPQMPGVDWVTIGLTLVKAAAFIGLMLLVGNRFIPWVLTHIAHMRSREIFILAVLVVALGTALGSASFFGVSLALGAFLAGTVVGASPFSHQVGADTLPFRDAFTVLFFVSVGMLVNPAYLLANAGQIAALTLLIILGKASIAAALGFLFPYPARTALVVAAGLSQIGEFSFILGQVGLQLGLLTIDQYSLILAGALVSITLNPWMFRLVAPVENALKRWPELWQLLDRHGPAPAPVGAEMSAHVVVVGYGRVGHHIVDVLGTIGVPRLVIESDAGRVDELRQKNVPTLYGDAANSEVVQHAGLERAQALVITLPDETDAAIVVAKARELAPKLPILARAATRRGVKHLAELGVQDVIHPELEGGLEIVRHTLLRLGLPFRAVQEYADLVRQEHYDAGLNADAEHRVLHQLLEAAGMLEVHWLRLEVGSPIVGQTLAEADLRSRTGASVVALWRAGRVIPNPKSQTRFEAGDRLGLIGEAAQIEAAERLLRAGPPAEALPASNAEAVSWQTSATDEER